MTNVNHHADKRELEDDSGRDYINPCGIEDADAAADFIVHYAICVDRRPSNDRR